jgi:hypothetical protein
MKITLAAVTAVAGLLVADAADAAIKNYKSTCTPENGATAGEGTAVVTYDDVAGKLCGTVTYKDLTGPVQAAHIHKQGGGILLDLDAAVSPMAISVAVTTNQAAEIAKETTYVNLHTDDFGAGELQCILVEDTTSTTNHCTATPTDAGADSGTDGGGSSSGGSSSGGSSSGGSSSGGSSGATTTRPDSGTENTAAPAEDDGCSTSGGSPTNGVLVALGAGVAIAGIARGRRKKK